MQNEHPHHTTLCIPTDIYMCMLFWSCLRALRSPSTLPFSSHVIPKEQEKCRYPWPGCCGRCSYCGSYILIANDDYHFYVTFLLADLTFVVVVIFADCDSGFIMCDYVCLLLCLLVLLVVLFVVVTVPIYGLLSTFLIPTWAYSQ